MLNGYFGQRPKLLPEISIIFTDNYPGSCSRAARQCSFHLSGSSALGRAGGQGYRTLTATWATARTLQLLQRTIWMIWANLVIPLRSMIHHGIIRTINILLLISGYLVMIPFKENFSREIPCIRFAQSVSATRNFVLVLSGPKPGRRSNGRSPSG